MLAEATETPDQTTNPPPPLDGGPTDGGEGTQRPRLVRGGLKPEIGAIVYYFEREAVLRAEAQGTVITPHAAIVTGSETYEGEDDLLQLIEFHPFSGPVVRRHVRYTDQAEANGWTWKPTAPVTVPFDLLASLVRAAVASALDVPHAPPQTLPSDAPIPAAPTPAEGDTQPC